MKRILLILLLAALGFAYYIGAFLSITVDEQEQGPYTLVYREMNGSDMKKAAEITTVLNASLAERGVTRRRPLDAYFPDGRAEIGFAIEGISPLQLGLADTKVRLIPRQRFLVARFPWRNAWSYLIGYLKTDPALAKYRALHGYEKVEAYALNEGDAIVYLQPIVKRISGPADQ